MRKLSKKTDFYRAYEGNKCPIHTFYGRIATGMSREEAIKPRHLSKMSELREYWEAQEGEKSSLNIFMLAVRHGLPREKAIQKGIGIRDIYPEEYKKWEEYKGDKCSFSTFIQRRKLGDFNRQIRPSKKQIRISNLTHEQAKRVIPESYCKIEITYKPEEAEVFHSIYRGMIDKNEEEINQEENYTTLKELEGKLNKIKQEYQSFLIFNPL